MYKLTLIFFFLISCVSDLYSQLEFTVEADKMAICENESSNLTVNIVSGTLPYTYVWSPSTGLSNPNINNPVANPSETTTYNVTVTDPNESKTKSITITVNKLPIVAFSANEVCESNASIFTNQTTDASWDWNFGDGSTNSTEKNPQHTYSKHGTYTVKLIATSAEKCINSLQKTITVNPKPKAEKFSPDEVCNGLTFVDKSTVASGSIVKRNWDFDDNSSASNSSSSIYHFYDIANVSYDVELTVTTDKECTDKIVQSVFIYPKPVTEKFSPDKVCNGFTFEDITTIETGSIVKRKWILGDGNIIEKNDSKLYYFFSKANINYNVELIAFSNKNCSDTVKQTIYIHPKPLANCTASEECYSNKTIFTNNSTVSLGTIDDYSWDYGDGLKDKNIFTHLYKKAGSYNVELIIETNNKCTDTTETKVIVKSKPITSKFSPDKICNGFTFEDITTIEAGNIVKRKWILGDGNVIEKKDSKLYYFFSKANINYNVELIAFSNKNCSDTVKQTIYIHPKPLANCTASEECYSNKTIFTNNSTVSLGTIDDYSWDYGDGLKDKNIFTHLYKKAGSYNVELIIETNNKCTDTIEKGVIVNPKPVTYKFSPDKVCNGFTFEDITTIETGNIVNRKWILGDGNVIEKNDTQLYYFFNKADINYNVELIAFSNKNCSDTVKQIIYIHPKPIANFIASTVCYKDTTRLTNNSIVSSGIIKENKWDFGDNQTDIDTLLHRYASAGSFDIRLIIKTEFECLDTINEIAIVYPLPLPNIEGHRIVCSNSVDEIYKANKEDGYKYEWKISSNGIFQTDNVLDSIVINWALVESESLVKLYLIETILATGCVDSIISDIKIDIKKSPSRAEIVFKANDPNTNILVCKDFSVTKWQWGYNDIKVNSDSARWHFWQINHPIDANNKYWLETSFNDSIYENSEYRMCRTRSYLTKEIKIDKIKIKNGLSINPNPANEFINFDIFNDYIGNIKIRIFNIRGKLEKQYFCNKNTKEFNKKLNISNLKKGIYVIKINYKNSEIDYKILIN